MRGTYIVRHDEAVPLGAAEVLDGAPLDVVLDAAADAVRPVPLGHDHVGEHEAAAAAAVVQEVSCFCRRAYSVSLHRNTSILRG